MTGRYATTIPYVPFKPALSINFDRLTLSDVNRGQRMALRKCAKVGKNGRSVPGIATRNLWAGLFTFRYPIAELRGIAMTDIARLAAKTPTAFLKASLYDHSFRSALSTRQDYVDRVMIDNNRPPAVLRNQCQTLCQYWTRRERDAFHYRPSIGSGALTRRRASRGQPALL